MNKSVKIAIIAGICTFVVVGEVALFVHLKLSDVEKNETGRDTAE